MLSGMWSTVTQETSKGFLNLSLANFAFSTDRVVNCGDGFGIFPLRVEICVKPTFKNGASLGKQ